MNGIFDDIGHAISSGVHDIHQMWDAGVAPDDPNAPGWVQSAWSLVQRNAGAPPTPATGTSVPLMRPVSGGAPGAASFPWASVIAIGALTVLVTIALSGPGRRK
jgi:hypothetical protein